MEFRRVGCRTIQKKKRLNYRHKQKMAYEISECDWILYVCSSDLIGRAHVCSLFTSRRWHTRFLNVTGVQTCALTIRCFFFFKQKTAYEISECDWSSDVCSSD